ncbi:hypothetical protein BDN71DRAFT_1433588 [Pleurotus eryngii]|uniref:Uncharacterized protein n=1 Tax=Pleurotus eryngii TaxID=5323 RepID=A0A9P5ZQU5_PLEER|nr:hypothetical protein BDN71DRAFT_1433588 [Pleurotus eryngii]
MSILDISPADGEPDVTSATNIVCGQCGTLNYMKDPKQYYAVTAGSQVGVVKGVDVGRGLIDYISGSVVIGFRTESLAVEHFQKGMRAGRVGHSHFVVIQMFLRGGNSFSIVREATNILRGVYLPVPGLYFQLVPVLARHTCDNTGYFWPDLQPEA